MKAKTPEGASFGKYIRDLRNARDLTQEQLGDASGLSTDTIRRLEHGTFSPSLDTLRKLCLGLELRLSVLFEGYELARDLGPDVGALRRWIRRRSAEDVDRVVRLLRAVLTLLDVFRGRGEL